MHLALVTASLLGQFTSIQLGPIQFSADRTRMSFEGVPCAKVTTRNVRITNTGEENLRISRGLVYGYHFNGALITGSTLVTEPGEFQDMRALYSPGNDTDKYTGYFDVTAQYDSSAIDEERERIFELAKEALGKVADRLAALDRKRQTTEEVIDAMQVKLRIQNQQELSAIQDELHEEQQKISRLRRQHEDYLEEYRQGLFCSGCGKTRSEILSEGDNFPHPGQRILRPTQAQIDALEAKQRSELEAVVSRAMGKFNTAMDKARAKFARSRDAIEQKRERALEAIEREVLEVKQEEAKLNRERDDLLDELDELRRRTKTLRVNLVGYCVNKTSAGGSP